jgi:hypothetical protein
VLFIIIEDARTFGNNIEDIQTQIETEDKLGIGGRSTDPRVAELERTRELQLRGLDLDEATERRIQGLDLSPEEGRQEFLEFQRDLFRRAQAGELTEEELGLFENVNDLTTTINSAADGVNAFEGALEDATRIIQGQVPEWFNVEEAIFKSRMAPNRPGDGASLPLGIEVGDVPSTPAGGFGTMSANDIALLVRAGALGRQTTINILAPINIPISGVNDPLAAGRAAQAAFQRAAAARGEEIDDVPSV